MILLKSRREIELIRNANRIVAKVLETLSTKIEEGITTEELDKIAEAEILQNNAIPAFKNYRGFPATICASINDEVVHGIPGKRKLKDGDIVSIDVGVKLNGYFGDAARTWGVGKISDEAKKLIQVTKDSFFKGIDSIKKGARLGDLSNAIGSYIEKNNFSVVRDFVGHGIGLELHEEPQIPNFGKQGKGVLLENGMTLAIEPMVNAGSFQVSVQENKWTVVTIDGAISAHYENTVAIIDNKVEVLTLYGQG